MNITVNSNLKLTELDLSRQLTEGAIAPEGGMDPILDEDGNPVEIAQAALGEENEEDEEGNRDLDTIKETIDGDMENPEGAGDE
jgi:hypothetical protein